MVRTSGIVLAVIALVSTLSACAKREVSYKKDVQPILHENCETCHSQRGVGYAESGFSVETYAALMKGTKYGPMVVAGQSGQSNLVWLLKHGGHPPVNMPKICEQMGQEVGKCAAAARFARELPQHQVKLIARWVDQGAKDN